MRSPKALADVQGDSIDLHDLARDGREVEGLARALEGGSSVEATFAGQFVASGSAKCPVKPSS